jgi:transglutaminase-like putative cysteine protease
VVLEIEHRLTFSYDAFIRESFLELRMQPQTSSDQTLLSFVLAVGPPSKIFRYRDWSDNLVHHFAISNWHDRIAVVSRSLVHTHPRALALGAVDDLLPLTGLPWDVTDYLRLDGPLRRSAALEAFSAGIGPSFPGTLGVCVEALGSGIGRRFSYRKDVTRYDSTTEDFLATGAGVCQDFTHLMLALLRVRGIPCRYVSGYLYVPREPAEVSQSHAWIEFFSPRHGWVSYDPTHGRTVTDHYVVVGHGRHYDDVPPNRGIFRGNARERLLAEVRTRLSAEKPVAALHDEVEEIDLPVYQEIPERKSDWASAALEEAASQQQQSA